VKNIIVFKLIQYVRPTWYFNLKPKGDIPYFPDWDRLSAEARGVIDWDKGYSSRQVSKLDAAYQALYRGIVCREPEAALPLEGIVATVEDNYRFLRKYYHPAWVVYVLIIRLLGLNNPWKEIRAFLRTRGQKRLVLHQKFFAHELAEGSVKAISAGEEKVAVIIPTLNRYDYLLDGLKDLEQQTYRNFEVIILDQSDPFRKDFYNQFDLPIRLIRQEEPALWLARNTAVEATDAALLLFYDDDSRVDADWIEQHVRCLKHFNCDISSGVSLSRIGGRVPEDYAYYKWADQLDTGNVMIRREVFYHTGLFDRQFEKQRMGDGEFGLRCYLEGFTNISNPVAKRIHLKVSAGGLRQMGHWDAFRSKGILSPRPVPSVLYLYRKYYGNRSARLAVLKNLFPSLVPYRFKSNRKVMLLGSILGLFWLPVALIQLWRSWRLSSEKLRRGPLVKPLEPARSKALSGSKSK